MRLSPLVLLAGLLAITAASTTATPPQVPVPSAPEEGRLPDSEVDLYPRPRPAVTVGTRSAPRSSSGIEEGPLPETLRQQLKREARTRTDLPVATELGPASPLTQTRPRPGIVSRFEGLDRSEAGGAFPPDTSLAVGPGHVLQVVNVGARLFTRDGEEVDSASLFDHFGVVQNRILTDPKVHFDPFTSRFFMVVLEISFADGEAYLHLSLSKTATPPSLGAEDWCNYRYSTVRRESFGDYPGLGMNERWLAVSMNNFGFSGGFVGSRLFVIDKSKVAGELSSCPSFKLYTFNLDLDESGNVVFNPQPAQHYDETGEKDTPLFAVSSHFDRRGAGSAYAIWRIAGKRKKPKLSHEIVAAEAYSIPPNAAQPGNLEVDSGDQRVMQQATYRNGQLWFAHATACEVKGSSSTLSCVRVSRVRPLADGGPVIDFQATLGRKNEYMFWPGVIVTADGDVIVASLRSGPDRLLETAVFGLRSGAARFEEIMARAKFSKPRTTEPGVCTPINLSFTPDGRLIARSGDYLGLALDLSTDEIWVSGEHGKTGQFGIGCMWGTEVVRTSF